MKCMTHKLNYGAVFPMIFTEISMSYQSSRPKRTVVRREPPTREESRVQPRAGIETITVPLPISNPVEPGMVITKVKEDKPPENEDSNPATMTTPTTAAAGGP